jgi:hypothetical protein
LAQAGWLSDVNFWIKDAPSAPGSLASTGGGTPGAAAGSASQGFSLTHDEAEDMVRRAEGVLSDIGDMLRKAETLTKVTPPAQDPASLTFNTQLVGNGQDGGAFGYGRGHLEREWGYLDELVKRLNDALGRTTESDHTATTIVNQATDGGIAQ